MQRPRYANDASLSSLHRSTTVCQSRLRFTVGRSCLPPISSNGSIRGLGFKVVTWKLQFQPHAFSTRRLAPYSIQVAQPGDNPKPEDGPGHCHARCHAADGALSRGPATGRIPFPGRVGFRNPLEVEVIVTRTSMPVMILLHVAVTSGTGMITASASPGNAPPHPWAH